MLKETGGSLSVRCQEPLKQNFLRLCCDEHVSIQNKLTQLLTEAVEAGNKGKFALWLLGTDGWHLIGYSPLDSAKQRADALVQSGAAKTAIVRDAKGAKVYENKGEQP